jgi:hypothetical protein
MPITNTVLIRIFAAFSVLLASQPLWGEESRFRDASTESQEAQTLLDGCQEAQDFTADCFELWRRAADPKAVEIDHQAGFYAAGYRDAVVFFPFNFVDGVVTPAPKLNIQFPEVIRGSSTRLKDIGSIRLKSAQKEIWVYDRTSRSTLVFSLGQFGNLIPIREIQGD